MRLYETILIVHPDVGEEERKEAVQKSSDLISRKKGVVVKVDDWGIQRLAYDIKKVNKGAYVRIEFCGDSGVTAELERDLKLDDRILKFQTVKLEDKVDPEELIRKEQESQKPSTPEPEEESQKPSAPEPEAEGQKPSAPEADEEKAAAPEGGETADMKIV